MIFLKPIWLFLNDEIVGIILFEKITASLQKIASTKFEEWHFNRTSKKGIGEMGNLAEDFIKTI
jgi:hypothetical protein